MPDGRLARTRAAYPKEAERRCPVCHKPVPYTGPSCVYCGWMPEMKFTGFRTLSHFVEGSPSYEGTPRQTAIITNIEEP